MVCESMNSCQRQQWLAIAENTHERKPSSMGVSRQETEMLVQAVRLYVHSPHEAKGILPVLDIEGLSNKHMVKKYWVGQGLPGPCSLLHDPLT